MVCHFYKNGYCTSPLLPTPDNTVTSKSTCFGDFRACRYYVESELKRELKINFFHKVNVIETEVHSECEYFDIKIVGKNYIAYCKAINRVLTAAQVKNCVNYWNSCPFRH